MIDDDFAVGDTVMYRDGKHYVYHTDTNRMYLAETEFDMREDLKFYESTHGCPSLPAFKWGVRRCRHLLTERT